MRGRLFFFFIIAAVVTVVLGIAGIFGPLGDAAPKSETTAQVDEKPAPILNGIASPSVRWTSETKVSENGKLRLSFRAEASSPLRTLQLKITPVTPPQTGLKITNEARDIPTWLMGNKAVDWEGDIDLTGSLMAGQQVAVQIVAVDEDRRSGASESVTINLPEHHFSQPVAQALYTLRKSLQQDPETRRNDALRALAGLLQQRSTFDNQDLALLTLRSAAVRIALDNTDEGLQSALDLLWHAAILFEDNPVANVTLSLRMSPKPVEAPATKPE